MKILVLFVLINYSFIEACVKSSQSDMENISCINLLVSEVDLKPEIISECSNMTKNDSWIGYLCLCRINSIKKNFKTALSACFKAKEKNPFSPHIYTEISNLYLLQGKREEALIEAEFALNLSTMDFNANFLSAKIIESRNPYKALTLYKNSLDILKKSNSVYIVGKKTYIEGKIKELEKNIVVIENKKKESDYSKCMNRYRKQTSKSVALKILEECFKIKKTQDINLNFKYLELLYENSKYQKAIIESLEMEDSIKENQKKEKLYLILANSYQKLGERKKALNYYSKLYKNHTQDINILNKYGELLEEDGNKIMAIEVYNKIYSINPKKELYEKIENLKIEAMGNDEILAEMKLRGFVEKEKVVLSPQDKKLFYSISIFERNNAIEWLTKTYPGYANLTVKNEKGELKLAFEGYNLYLKYISQQAIKHFQKNNVIPNFLFRLLDENGNMIFDSKGRLTYEGLIAYYKAKDTGKKTWFYSTELPSRKVELNSSYQAKQVNDEKALKEIERLKKQNYDEISEDEYLFLLSKTTCPEDIILSYPCNLKKIKVDNKIRYFICSSPKCVEDAFYTPIKLYSYIISYREGTMKKDNGNAASNFFGSGSKKRNFCEDGKIWKGPEFTDEAKRNEELQKELDLIKKHKEKMSKFIEGK